MISVVIGTHGTQHWADLARDRARPSTEGQDGIVEALCVHTGADGTLAQARNAGAAQARGDWLVFLDADDELAPDFGTQIATAIDDHGDELALFTPAVQYVQGARRPTPKVWPTIDLRDGNYLVIGTAISRRLFHEIGGFKEWPLYEDWCLWQRAENAGAWVVEVPDAVYVAHVNANSRNRMPRRRERERIHHEIRRANHPELYEQEART